MIIPFSLVIPTAYGTMIVNRNDINQTNALVKTGYAIDHGDIAVLANIVASIPGNLTVADVGANFGTYSLGLAMALGGRGKIHAFEPQRILFNMIAGSVAINSLLNVYCHNMAVGDRNGKIELPQFDYTKPLNFGSIEFTGSQSEQLTQLPGTDASRVEYVPITTLDGFGFDRLDLLKIDVEGMEANVLRGAKEVIDRCKPIIFAEHLKSDRKVLLDWMVNAGYVVYENSMNFLGVSKERRDLINICNRATNANAM